METAVILKEGGVEQRVDVELTESIANALADLIAAGVTLYPKKKPLELTLREGETEKSLSLPVGTLNSWVTRGNVIPETGQSLRAFLDGKREEKSVAESQARQTAIRENAEKRLQELSGITIKPTEIKKYYKIDEEGNKVLSREEHTTGSAKLAEVVVKGLVFGLERLDPQRYGSKAEVNHTHFVFDLARLRQARQKREQLKREEMPI